MSDRARTSFGLRLYQARTAAGLTQKQVQAALGISQSTLSELEREAHSSGFTPVLATLYKADPHYLATGELKVAEPLGLHFHISRDRNTRSVPTLNWNALMNEPTLPQEFEVAMPDSSMEPRLRCGDIVSFSRSLAARPGDGVLVRDAEGALYVRIYRARRGDVWEAHASSDAYQPLESAADGLQVLAVLTGVRQRWG